MGTTNHLFILLAFLVLAGWPKGISAQIPLQQERTFIHYTDADGLPYSGITDFVQDKTGFMWVATWINICRFDGYRFREFPVLDFEGAPAVFHWPRFFMDDKSGQIYFYSSDNRIFKYHDEEAVFKEYRRLEDTFIQDFYPAEEGGFWVAQNNNIYHLDSTFQKRTLLTEYLPFTAKKLAGRPGLAVAKYGRELYVLLEGGRLARIRPDREEVVVITDLPSDLELSFPRILADRNNQIWIKSVNAGVVRVNQKDGKTLRFSEQASEPFRLTSNFVRTIAEDEKGNIWIGTENGLNIWNAQTGMLERHQYDLNKPEGINSNAIYAIYCDRAGDVWVGTYFGGINLYSAGREFFNFLLAGEEDHNLGGHQVSCIVEDTSGNIYVGLEGDGFNKIDVRTGKVKKFAHQPGKNSLSYDNVHTMAFDSAHRLYIGTYTGGLNIYDPEQDRFSVINTDNTPDLPNNNIYCLFQQGDSIFVGTNNGMAVYRVPTGEMVPFYKDALWGKWVRAFCLSGTRLWIGTEHALFHYDLHTGDFQQFGKFDGPVNLSSVTADEDGNIWIGDDFRGLFVYWKDQDSLHHYDPSAGFPAKRVFGMVPGKGDYFWLSTNQGLIKFFPETHNWVVYDRQSGLPFSQFNYLAFYKARSDDIYFGGISGLIYFNEEEDSPAKSLEPVVFTDLELFYESVDPKESPVLSRPVHQTEAIRLKYEQNVFTIHYSALNYTHPGRVQYAYYLEGFESGWNLVGNKKSVSYTNLSPGKYTFHVKASYDNSTWSAPATKMEVVVAPPFYQSTLAYIIYALLILGGLIAFYLISVKIEKSKSAAALERKEKENREKLNRLKLEFFTNVSHDFRTPLTLIMGPVQQLLRHSRIDAPDREKLSQVNRNAQRLLNLVNQLMDFRRVDGGQEKLRVQKINIVWFVREVKQAFEVMAENRQIQFDFCYQVSEEKVYFDPQKVERILFNLLSNAFKFTAEHGRVALELLTEPVPGKEGGTELTLRVRDNGVGISEAQLDQVFDRFFKKELSTSNSVAGSGIGLAFVKSVVELHKGSIEVDSEEGAWTEFVVKIPVGAVAYQPAEMDDSGATYLSQVNEWMGPAEDMMSMPAEAGQHPDKLNILVVDDNVELLSFLQQSLTGKFNVWKATNGREGLEIVQKKKPDLVISDVVMPRMDGLTFTQQLKENVETSHIPVILLTAKTEADHQYEGFSAGADFYIEKPFYPHLLIKHVENVLSTRNRLIELFKKDLNLPPAKVAHSRPDQEFIEKLTTVIEDNIDNPDLDVSFLLKEMCISRSLLHLKLKNIVDCSATEYIRSVRLKKSAKLILSGGRTIKEVAYATGFSSPSLFSRCFKKHFGKSPRQYAKLADTSKRPAAS